MYIESIDRLRRITSKYSYISCLIPVGIFALLDCKYHLTYNLLTDDDKISSLSGLIATFIGFLLMALTIFITMPKQSNYYQKFHKYGHDKIFAISCALSAVFLFLYIFLWMFVAKVTTVILYIFICGIAELIVVFYYAFRMTMDS